MSQKPLLYVVRMDFAPDKEAEINRWYNEDHVPALLTAPGFFSAVRYISTSGEPKYMAAYDIAGMEVFNNDTYKKVRSTDWGEQLRPHRLNVLLEVYDEVFSLKTRPAPTTSAAKRGETLGSVRAPCLITVRTDVAPEAEEEFVRWYKEEHIPNLTGIPGWSSGRLLRAVQGQPKYMSLWELESAEVLKHLNDRAAVAARETPWTHLMRTCMSNRKDNFHVRL